MKSRKNIFLIITLLILTNCNSINTSTSLNTSSFNETSRTETTVLNTTSQNTSLLSPSTSSIISPSSTNTALPSSTSTISSTSNNASLWEDGRTLLECGFYQMDLPKNYQNPYQLKTTLSQDNDSWSNNDLKEELPDGFRYIYKNSCDDGPAYHKSQAKFYSSNNNNPGGLKIADVGVGFQSKMFVHNGAKLEIRIGISQVNNASDKPDEGKDTFHVYFFNKEGNYLNKYAVSENTIKTSTKEIKFYWTENASEIAYFEFRCNAKPYKGQQCYNVGISYCNIKSWERA